MAIVSGFETEYNKVMNRIKRFFSFLWRHKFYTAGGIILLLILFFIFRPKPAPIITTQKVEPTDVVQTVSVSGTIDAKSKATLTFPVGGTISWVGVKVGDTVIQGQTIATLDQRTALKNLQQSLLAYSIARNNFDQTAQNNGGPNQQAALSIAPNTAVLRVLQDNQYNLDTAVNSVELADLAKQQSILSTPIAGIVTRADATTPGITAGPTLAFAIVDPTSVVFNMDVDEADISKIQQEQTADITLDAYPNSVLHLPVQLIDFVSHTTTNGGNAFTVQVALDSNADYKYRVGMNGDADITTAKRVGVLAVPLSSIVNNNQVYIQQGKKYIKKTITLGLQSDTETEVTAGLNIGDIIAVDPTQIPKNQQ